MGFDLTVVIMVEWRLGCGPKTVTVINWTCYEGNSQEDVSELNGRCVYLICQRSERGKPLGLRCSAG